MVNLPEEEVLGSWFPLFTQDEFEANLNNAWPVGINRNYPIELLSRLSAASASLAVGYKSVDYFLKKFGYDFPKDPGGDQRKDRRLREFCLSSLGLMVEGIQDFRSNIESEGTMGEYLSDMTIGRLPYSMGRAFAEVDKGALFEGLVIGRMILEQACWSLGIRELDDRDEIQAVSVTKSISPIAKQFPQIGKLNGYLSNHAHWSYDAHVKVAFDSPGYVMMASSSFKACGYIVLTILSLEIRKITTEKLTDFISDDVVEIFNSDKFELEVLNARKEVSKVAKLLIEQYPDLVKIFR